VNGSVVTLTASPAVSYLWSTGATTQSIDVGASGSYTVTETNSYGCTSQSPPVLVSVTPTGSNVAVTDGNVTTTFGAVSTGGITSVTPIPPGIAGSLPGGYEVSNLGIAYEISTTSQVSGPIVIQIQLTPQQLAGMDQATFNSLRIMHGESGTLVDRTILPPDSPAPDFATGTLYARVATLSPFVVAKSDAPTVGAIVGPTAPLVLGSTASVSARFTDTDHDSHGAIWQWNDGSTSNGLITESNGIGAVTGSHVYTVAGVYAVNLTVTNSRGLNARQTIRYVVIYDPTGGFVTGGGWITVSGAKATFGINAKYLTGSTTPTGQSEFQFQFAGSKSSFHSTAYEWLVVNGGRGQYRGSGTIDGTGDYGFLITAVDGNVTGGDGIDRFRIRIWSKTTGASVYDSGSGPDDALPNAIGGGRIVVHP
jgi:PKD repeat protein